jgi:hypothetical protein
MLTAWDGYTRVDYLPDPGRVRVTLLTVEPVVHRRVRPGLACAFVADDATGPPAFVEVDVGWGKTDELLLGKSIMSVITGLAGGGTRHVRLGLDEVAGLADRWAPYRSQVLGTAAESGSLASGLWTSFRALGFTRALRTLSTNPDPAFRDGNDLAFDWQPILLPVPLAQDAGVKPMARWVAYRQQTTSGEVETGVVIQATAVPGHVGRLLTGLDDRDDTWVQLEPDPDDSTLVVADLPVDPGTTEPALRFRSEGRWQSRSSQSC